ncbi:MAG: DUF3293 domain-containing protein [Chloroflexi bacterium]|nr:DUF3293 domain-containing protein [Chloroflexota bacterium]
MHPAYFETCFLVADLEPWPLEFAILSAYATTGEQWTPERNQVADRVLEAELLDTTRWMRRLTGFSPISGHAEPSWAVQLPFATACDVGLRYQQDAIYFVAGDDLSVSFCDARRRLIQIGRFRERLRLATP